nr:hypothetical protein [Rhodoferax sp.]
MGMGLWAPAGTVLVGAVTRGATGAGNGASDTGWRGAPVGCTAGTRIGTVAVPVGGFAKVGTAADGTLVGVGLGGDAGGSARSGLVAPMGAVLVGADARDATVGRWLGRNTMVGEGSPGFVGGQGKPAMRYRVQSTLSSAKLCGVKPAIAIKMHNGT